MFKNIDFSIKTRCTPGDKAYAFFPEQACNLVTVLVCLSLALLLEKLSKIQMRMFEIVAHRNVDNWTQ